MKRFLYLCIFSSLSLTLAHANTYSREQIHNLGLPVIEIYTDNGIEPSCDKIDPPAHAIGQGITNADKVPAQLIKYVDGNEVYNSGLYVKGESGITIKVRGNTSARCDKKPYKIKLQKKADLLQRDNPENYSDKNWLLIKDDSLRALAGLKVSEILGMQWTPSCEYVNVILNNDYKGVYLLIESVSRNSKCRLDVDETGYLFEFDAYWWNEPYYVQSPTPLWTMMHYTLKYPEPEDIGGDRKSEFERIINEFEGSLKSGDYPKYIDVNSCAKWLLCHDILGNGDPCGTNVYLTKFDNMESKLQMECLWDYDRILEMKDDWSRQHICGVFCFGPLLSDKSLIFLNEYYQIWEDVKETAFDDVLSYLQKFTQTVDYENLSRSLILDNDRWGGAKQKRTNILKPVNQMV